MPNLALFDFDGTITVKDSFMPFIYRAVSPARIALGSLALAPRIAAYKLGILPATKMRALIVRVGLAGQSEAAVRRTGVTYAQNELPKFIRPAALAKIAWHKAEGDVVVVVSASLDVYLLDWCQRLGIELISTQLESRAGVLTGRYQHGDCSGKEKARRIGAKYTLASYPIIYAYGDTREDDEMLNLAHKRYFRWREL